MKFTLNRRDFLQQCIASGAFLSTALTIDSPAQKNFSSSKKIVVVGAGLAGLSAAFELRKSGHEVTILEARTRVGGRVHTLREPFSDSLYAEAGAFWIPQAHFFTLRYIKLFKLPIVTFSPNTVFSNYLLRDSRFKTTEVINNRLPDLSSVEKGLSIEGLQAKYFTPGLKEIGDATAPGWSPEAFKKYDEITFGDYLRRQGASRSAIELLRLGLDLAGDGIDNCSALALLREMALGSSPRYHRIKGGNDLLPKAFAQQMSGIISYGAEVIKIDRSREGIRVTYLQGGAEKSVAGDYLICAIPFPLLKKINVSPAFSPEKRRAIDELKYTSVSRVFLQSRKKFWLQNGLHGYTSTDSPVQFTGDATLFQNGARGLLESYAAGRRARHIAGLPDEKRIDFVRKEMERVYPGIGANYEGGVSKCWDEDRWAAGAYSWFGVGDLTTLKTTIARPEGRIYFAGEHTSSWVGWMQGALESGFNAAQKINESIGKSPARPERS